MFMFPEPPPIGYYITDVSPSYLSDGIFHYGKPAPTHKHVAKQLKSIKRSLSDPVAPIQDIDARVVDQWIKRKNEGFVDPPGLDNGKVFETLSLMPQWKHVHRSSKDNSFSIFPRSQQYELWHIRDRRLRNAKKLLAAMTERPGKDEIVKTATNGEACDYLKPPFWRGDETARSASVPVGDINDYVCKKLQEPEQDSRKMSEKLHMDRKHIPAATHRMKNPEDRSMKEVPDKDASKVAPQIDANASKNRSSVDGCVCSAKNLLVASVPRGADWKEDARRIDKPFFDSDTRWQLVYEQIGFSGTDLERQRELHVLTKPFSHELHKWYSKNKPTKFAEPVKRKGKRPMPEMRFSHL